MYVIKINEKYCYYLICVSLSRFHFLTLIPLYLFWYTFNEEMMKITA